MRYTTLLAACIIVSMLHAQNTPTDPGQLPVKVTKMGIERPKYRNILMLWETAQEINNSHYEIMRSEDNGNTWQKVGDVKGIGNSNNINSYSFTDDISQVLQTGATDLFYKIRQVDFDGKDWHSFVLAIKLTDFVTEDLTVFPNPSIGHVTITGVNEHVIITDITGHQIVIDSKLKEVTLDNLSKGMYFIQSGNSTRKLLVQ